MIHLDIDIICDSCRNPMENGEKSFCPTCVEDIRSKYREAISDGDAKAKLVLTLTDQIKNLESQIAILKGGK